MILNPVQNAEGKKMNREIIVYVAGKYSAENQDDIKFNIAVARNASIKIWEAGFTAFCPHLNTAFFHKDCKCTREDYLKGNLYILRKCDALLLLPDWFESEGAKLEYKIAHKSGIPVFESLDELKKYFGGL